MGETSVLDLADGYSKFTLSELERAIDLARQTQMEAADLGNETVFLQQDRVIQAIAVAKQRLNRSTLPSLSNTGSRF